MTPLTLHKNLYRDVPMFMPGVGDTLTDHEIVTALEPAHGPILPFRHFDFDDAGVDCGTVQPETLTMPTEMAKRVLAFCEATYFDGQDGFNCYSFVDFTMGWDDQIRTGVSRRLGSKGVGTEPTQTNEPYYVYTPGGHGGDIAHLLLGGPKTGHAFNVLGPNMPLAISKNTDLLRIFGGTSLHHILSYERLA